MMGGGGPTGHEGDGGHHLQAAQATRSLGAMCVTPSHLQTAAAVSIRAHGVMPGGLFLCYRCHGFLKQCVHVSLCRAWTLHTSRGEAVGGSLSL
jgi:hypothetical protein